MIKDVRMSFRKHEMFEEFQPVKGFFASLRTTKVAANCQLFTAY